MDIDPASRSSHLKNIFLNRLYFDKSTSYSKSKQLNSRLRLKTKCSDTVTAVEGKMLIFLAMATCPRHTKLSKDPL